MSGFTYEQIATVLESAESQGLSVKCVFTCPKTGYRIESVGVPEIDQQKMQADAMKSGYMKAGGSMVINSILNMVGLGRYAGTISRVFGGMQSTQPPAGITLSEDDKRTAVVNAFMPYSTMFEWNESEGTLVAAQQPGTGETV